MCNFFRKDQEGVHYDNSDFLLVWRVMGPVRGRILLEGGTNKIRLDGKNYMGLFTRRNYLLLTTQFKARALTNMLALFMAAV